MQIVKKIIIDLSRKGTANVIDAVQYDVNTRVVEITLLQNGIPWNVPDGVTAAVGYKKSDGTRGLYDQLPDNSKAVSISGNVITAILVGQVLTVSGMVKASILMHDSNLNQLTTFPFDVNVVPNPSGTEEVSNDYYKYTTMQAVSDAVDAWLTETSEKQDTFLEAGSKALEVIKETINDGEYAPPIICAANGEVIAVSDASDRLFRGLHIYGKTTQNGTPTPEAPVPLESVGADGNVAVTVCGKNLVDSLFDGNVAYTKYVSHGDDGSVCVNNTSSGTIYPNTKAIVFPAGTYTFSIERVSGVYSNIYIQYGSNQYSLPLNEAVHKRTITFTENTSVQLMFAVSAGYSTNYRIQVESGSVATAYEPYKEPQTLTAQKPTDVSVFLPGIPVTSGGDYTDENGQQWICDEIDFARGKYVQRVTSRVFDGTEEWKHMYNNGRFGLTEDWGTGNVSGIKTAGISTHYHWNQSADMEDKAFRFAGVDNPVKMLYLVDYSFKIPEAEWVNGTQATNFKEFLAEQYAAGTPVTIQYILTPPIETDLTAEEIAQYSALHTNYPNTTIYNDEGAGMEVKYVADTKLYIDNKFAELASAIVNNA